MQKKKQNNKNIPHFDHFDTDLTSSYGYYGIENELFSVLRWVPPSILPNRFKDQKADLYNIWVLCTASTFVESDGCVRTSSLISSGMKNPWVFFGPLNWFFQAWVFFDNLKKPDIYRDSCRFWEKQTTYPYLFCGFDTFPLLTGIPAHLWTVNSHPQGSPCHVGGGGNSCLGGKDKYSISQGHDGKGYQSVCGLQCHSSSNNAVLVSIFLLLHYCSLSTLIHPLDATAVFGRLRAIVPSLHFPK